jgi:hypothetical protein
VPFGLHMKGPYYYLVTTTVPREWTPLGKDRARALLDWARIEGDEPDPNECTFEVIALRYGREVIPGKAGIDLEPLMGLPTAVKDLVHHRPHTHHGGQPPEHLGPGARSGLVCRGTEPRRLCGAGQDAHQRDCEGRHNPSHPLPWNPCDAEVRRMTGASSQA